MPGSTARSTASTHFLSPIISRSTSMNRSLSMSGFFGRMSNLSVQDTSNPTYDVATLKSSSGARFLAFLRRWVGGCWHHEDESLVEVGQESLRVIESDVKHRDVVIEYGFAEVRYIPR